MAGGFGKYIKKGIDFSVDAPHVVYLMGGLTLAGFRKYKTQTTYNYWFGKCEFERRLAAGRV